MKQLSIFLLVAAMAHAQLSQYDANGWLTTVSTQTAINFNAAATRLGIRHVARNSAAVSKWYLYVSSASTAGNAPTGSDVYAEIIQPFNLGFTTPVTYDDANDVITWPVSTENPLVAGDTVAFDAATTLPGGITARTLYYVCSTALTSTVFGVGTGYSGGDCTGRVTNFSGSSGTQTVRKVLEVVSSSTAPASSTWMTLTFPGVVAPGIGGEMALYMANIDGNPGSVNWQVRALSNSNGPLGNSTTSTHGPSGSFLTSTTAGTSWSGPNMAYYMVEYVGGAVEGWPVETVATTTGVSTGERVFGTQEAGQRWTFPFSVRVAGARACLSKIGTPTANFTFKIYTGANASEVLPTNGTSSSVFRGEIATTAGCVDRYFPAVHEVAANAPFRLVGAADNTSDTSSNSYSFNTFTVRNDASAKTLMNGVQALRVSGTFSYVDTKWLMIAPIFDWSNPIPATSGGSSGAATFEGP